MDAAALVKAAGIVPEGKRASFVDYLSRLPKTPGLVDRPHRTEQHLQGDILREFPFCVITGEEPPVVKPITVAVLNNTCDLQPNRSDFVNVSPVIDFAGLRESIQAKRSEASAKDFLRDVQNNNVAELFYVESCPTFDGAIIIMLDRISTARAEIYQKAVERDMRVASFTQNGFYLFLIKLTNFLARAETPDVARLSHGPEAGCIEQPKGWPQRISQCVRSILRLDRSKG
jgi:hypothetical protein